MKPPDAFFPARPCRKSRELAFPAARPEATEHALALMDPDEPPSAAQLRDLCSTAPVFRARFASKAGTPGGTKMPNDVQRQCCSIPTSFNIHAELRDSADAAQ